MVVVYPARGVLFGPGTLAAPATFLVRFRTALLSSRKRVLHRLWARPTLHHHGDREALARECGGAPACGLWVVEEERVGV